MLTAVGGGDQIKESSVKASFIFVQGECKIKHLRLKIVKIYTLKTIDNNYEDSLVDS